MQKPSCFVLKLIFLFAVVSDCRLASGQQGTDGGLPYVPGELIIKFRQGIDASQAGGEMSAAGEDGVLRSWSRLNAVLVKVPSPAEADAKATVSSLQATIRSLAGNAAVEWVQPNYLYYADQTIPNDPQVGSDFWFLDELQLPEAWDVIHDADDVVVAVIDTGIMLNHDDLATNLWTNPNEQPNDVDDDGNGIVDDLHGADFYNRIRVGDQDLPTGDPSADLVAVPLLTSPICIGDTIRKRYESHGTHVAGVIGAVGNNAKGISGIAWNVQIMALKFLGGTCARGKTSDAVDAIDYALDHDADIINCSWGGGEKDLALQDMLRLAEVQGTLVVCAAGNSNRNNDVIAHYPSNFDFNNIISVAASNQDDGRAQFANGGGSNFGKTSVDLAAPGKSIMSTIPDGNENSKTPSPAYRALSGTSMAAPMVTGTAALVKSKYPTLTAAEIRSWLMLSVDKSDDPSSPLHEFKNRVASEGRLNVARALTTPNLPDPIAKKIAALPAAQRQQLSPEDHIRANLRGPGAGNTAMALPVKGVIEGTPKNPNDDAALNNQNLPEQEFVIAFDGQPSNDQVDQVLKQKGVVSVRKRLLNERLGLYAVYIRCNIDSRELVASLQRSKNVRYVQTQKSYTAE